MTEHVDDKAASTGGAITPELTEGEAFTRGRPSIVWLIPVLALMVGGWLGYKTGSEKGPEIEISIKDAAGKQVGKTVIKFKDAEVGKVAGICAADDLKRVLVTAELVAGTAPWLTQGTRFWIARPRVAAGHVSGLDTFLSGAFIEMDPVIEGKRSRTVMGLEEPPFFKTGEPGKRFNLLSDGGAVVGTGTPVYFREQQVRQVIASRLDDAGEAVDIEMFITAPHDRLVRTNTRFWNIGGLDLTLDADGIRLDSESFVTLLLGGLTFAATTTIDEESSDAPSASVSEQDGFKVVPTVPASLEAVAAKVNGLLETLAGLPLDEIATDLLHTVEGANRLVNSKEAYGSLAELERLLAQTGNTIAKIDGTVVPEAAQALIRARAMLGTAQALITKDSTMVGETTRLLRELSAAARSFKGLAEF
jgi:paraquat-inducible protein B